MIPTLSLVDMEQKMTWRDKALKVVDVLCVAAYNEAKRKANKERKKKIPYSVPDAARDLIDALDNDDEERAKAIMMYNYDVQQTLNGK